MLPIVRQLFYVCICLLIYRMKMHNSFWTNFANFCHGGTVEIAAPLH